jgi:hypothetical protein
MNIEAFYGWCMFAGCLPFLAIAVIVVHFFVLRWRGGLRKRRGRGIGFYPSVFALGTALQFMQIFWQPEVEYVVEAKLEEDVDEDESGDPETLSKQLGRQLRRIRRGEPVERLVLRL